MLTIQILIDEIYGKHNFYQEPLPFMKKFIIVLEAYNYHYYPVNKLVDLLETDRYSPTIIGSGLISCFMLKNFMKLFIISDKVNDFINESARFLNSRLYELIKKYININSKFAYDFLKYQNKGAFIFHKNNEGFAISVKDQYYVSAYEIPEDTSFYWIIYSLLKNNTINHYYSTTQTEFYRILASVFPFNYKKLYRLTRLYIHTSISNDRLRNIYFSVLRVIGNHMNERKFMEIIQTPRGKITLTQFIEKLINAT